MVGRVRNAASLMVRQAGRGTAIAVALCLALLFDDVPWEPGLSDDPDEEGKADAGHDPRPIDDGTVTEIRSPPF